MGILSSIFWKINSNALDLRDYFDPLFKKEGFVQERSFVDGEHHLIYSKDGLDFDFWWKRGNRPILYVRQNGDVIQTDIYNTLIENHSPKYKALGAQTYYIYSKLDKEVYYNVHQAFVLNLIKSGKN